MHGYLTQVSSLSVLVPLGGAAERSILFTSLNPAFPPVLPPNQQDESCFNVDSSTIDRADPSNTNVYLGNVSPETNEEDLMVHFSGEWYTGTEIGELVGGS